MPLDWSTELLRLSLFSSDTLQVTDADWLTLTGQETSDIRQVIPGGRVYAGKVGDLQLQIAASGLRIDLVATQPPATELTEPRFNSIGPWIPSRDAFVERCERWLGSSAFSFNRVAFGTVLLRSTSNHRETLTLLKDVLKSVSIDLDGMRELQFRVNWPLNSRVKYTLEINRITQWAALQASVQLVQLTSAAMPLPPLSSTR